MGKKVSKLVEKSMNFYIGIINKKYPLNPGNSLKFMSLLFISASLISLKLGQNRFCIIIMVLNGNTKQS